MEDLDSFRPELAALLRMAQDDCLPLFEESAAEVLASLRSKVPGETGEMEEPKTKGAQILLTSKEDQFLFDLLGLNSYRSWSKYQESLFLLLEQRPKLLM